MIYPTRFAGALTWDTLLRYASFVLERTVNSQKTSHFGELFLVSIKLVREMSNRLTLSSTQFEDELGGLLEGRFLLTTGRIDSDAFVAETHV